MIIFHISENELWATKYIQPRNPNVLFPDWFRYINLRWEHTRIYRPATPYTSYSLTSLPENFYTSALEFYLEYDE